MNTKNVLLLSILFIVSACKTQEDIRRERTMENINEKINQTQQYSANSTLRFQNLEEQIAKLTGDLEEVRHKDNNDNKDLVGLKDRLEKLEDQNKKDAENIKALAEKINEQSKYLEQVVKSLNEIAENKEVSKKKVESTKIDPDKKDIKTATKLFKDQNYTESKSMFEELLDNPKIKKKDKATGLYYLGQISYKLKKYDEAKVYFSKLFTEIPDSNYSASSLLFLAKIFKNLKATEEARQTLDELITRFPKSKEGVEGAKLKAKL